MIIVLKAICRTLYRTGKLISFHIDDVIFHALYVIYF